MSVIAQAQEILADVNDIRDAIIAKGGNPGTLFTFASEIANLPTGGGMPAIPASWNTLANYGSFTATGDGWIWYKICYYWGMGQKSFVTVGSRTYEILLNSGSEVEDIGRVTAEGYAPMYSGETVSYTAQGSLSIVSFCKYAYV